MSRLETVRRLVTYDRRVYDRYERAIHRAGWAEATKNREIGHLSLKNTLLHLLNAREAWLVIIPEERWEVFDEKGRQPAEVHSWAELRRYRRRVWEGVDRTVAGLTEAKLRRIVKAPWMPGRYTLEDAFFQASFEQAHHLGEIIAVFWQADWKPPKMTWIENTRGSAR